MIGETVGITIPRNYFDLSQEHIFTAEAGIIYPIYSTMLLPGDVIKISNQCVIRQQPTINPSFSNFKVRFWDFVVAIRNLDKNIYRFLSGYTEYNFALANLKAIESNPYYNENDYCLICLGVVNMEGTEEEVGIIYEYKDDFNFIFDKVQDGQKPKYNSEYFKNIQVKNEERIK